MYLGCQSKDFNFKINNANKWTMHFKTCATKQNGKCVLLTSAWLHDLVSHCYPKSTLSGSEVQPSPNPTPSCPLQPQCYSKKEYSANLSASSHFTQL